MNENYLITIDNKQSNDIGEEENISLSTVGEYIFDGHKRTIRYTDSAATGFDGCITKLDIDKDGIVFSRSGAQSSTLILQNGKRFIGHYGTPYGDMALGVYTESIEDNLGENGGEIRFCYSLDLNTNFFAKNDLRITVREKKKNV